MDTSFKVKYLNHLDLSKWFNHYKEADKAVIKQIDNALWIKGNRISREISKVTSLSDEAVGGIHLEKWVRINYVNGLGKNETLYVLSSKWFGLDNVFNGNEALKTFLQDISLKTNST